ncbi:ATP-dependent Clp protease proteolytic subunit-related protein 3, chloroplastic isoform X2 [Carica papaya]|uniref:ATP-dependent Clp protease proteolytic subunit-related protein 3, chloroplastic isoform X2 n=1 Tax=Carica papaya TaxID=3649 RepID=UPI000B8D0321|nr:ATP-dependent Clp protease proteolytic subunit-related protein 3, chloroplastic isoform X2 [Carica papaya]
MASCLQVPMAYSIPSCSSSSSSSLQSIKRGSLKSSCCALGAKSSAKIPMPPVNPKDPFLSKLASVAATSPEAFLNRPVNSDTPPYLDLFDSPKLMASPAQLVPAVTELVVAELMYLQWMDPKQPIYLYINSTGTTRDDGETVGMETEGFAIYDALMQLKNEIHTVAVGAAIGQACLLLAAGTKGKRFMMPHAKAMIQQPRLPSSGLMPASDVLIRAREAVINRDTLAELLAKHTGNSVETVASVMKRPFYMDSTRAKEFGVIDKILWRGQDKIMADAATPEEWDRNAGIKVVDGL